MNNFKEWLSDNLRYFMLAGIIILVLAAAIFGINAYSKLSNNTDKKDTATEQETPQTETKKEETETKESETETKKAAETEKQTEKMKETEVTEAVTEAVTEPQLAAAPQTEAVPETEAVPQTEPAPVYLTLKSACYIRSGPSYEAEIIGEYWGGQTVRFIEDAGGWYKVEVDGMIGYMGARFF